MWVHRELPQLVLTAGYPRETPLAQRPFRSIISPASDEEYTSRNTPATTTSAPAILHPPATATTRSLATLMLPEQSVSPSCPPRPHPRLRGRQVRCLRRIARSQVTRASGGGGISPFDCCLLANQGASQATGIACMRGESRLFKVARGDETSWCPPSRGTEVHSTNVRRSRWLIIMRFAVVLQTCHARKVSTDQ